MTLKMMILLRSAPLFGDLVKRSRIKTEDHLCADGRNIEIGEMRGTLWREIFDDCDRRQRFGVSFFGGLRCEFRMTASPQQ